MAFHQASSSSASLVANDILTYIDFNHRHESTPVCAAISCIQRLCHPNHPDPISLTASTCLDCNPLVDAFTMKQMQAREAAAHLAHTNIFSADHAWLLCSNTPMVGEVVEYKPEKLCKIKTEKHVAKRCRDLCVLYCFVSLSHPLISSQL